MADKQTTYAVRVKAESNADEAASSVIRLQKQLDSSQNAVKQYAAALRNLKGDSEAVKATKEKLSTQIKAEKDKISQATLSLLQHNAALKAAKPTMAAVKEESNLLADAVEKLSGGWKVALAAAVAFVAGVGVAAMGLAKFVFESANALRTMSLFREAATGSEANALALGHQIEALAGKVPQTREELNKLAVEMSRSFNGTRVSGQGMVDTLNAVSQAASAMGDTAGGKIQEIIERSKQWGRLGIGLFELQGTGISFTDVTGQLAKDLGIGIAAAQQQLRFGRVNVNAGAKAIREVVERQFGGINAKRMLDLNVVFTKFEDNLVGLASDVDLTVLVGSITKITELFAQSSDTGKAMKSLLKDFGSAVGAVFEAAAPFVKTFVEEFTLAMLRFELAGLKAAVFIKEKFGIDITKALGDTSIAAKLADMAVFGLAVGLTALITAAAAVAAYMKAVDAGISALRKGITEWKNELTSGNWAEVGSAIIQGILSGLNPGQALTNLAMGNLANGMKEAFKKAWDIRSPSKVGFELGAAIPAGIRGGVDSGAPDVEASIGKVAAPPRVDIKGGGGGNTTTNTFNIEVHVAGGNVAALHTPSARAQLLQLFEELAIEAGLTPQGAT